MRQSVYWPNIHKDIEKMVKSCAACQENQTEHSQQPLVAHDVPSTPWTKVASDMFEIKGDNYLIITDYQSKFHVVQKTISTTSNTIAHITAEWFSVLEPPLEIVTDNGPQYVGKPYEDMCCKWNVKHTTTSPRYSESNGLVERQVTTVKGILKKCKKTGNDAQIALQHQRCTPIDTSLASPSEITFNRPVRTNLPSPHPTLQSQQMTNEVIQQWRDHMVNYHNQGAGPELAPLLAGQRVRILDKETHQWHPGVVISTCA